MYALGWVFVVLAAETNLLQFIYPEHSGPLLAPLALFCVAALTLFNASERDGY